MFFSSILGYLIVIQYNKGFRPCNSTDTVVWEKFMVRNIREKKIRGKIFSSKQATDENILTPNISYVHILTM